MKAVHGTGVVDGVAYAPVVWVRAHTQVPLPAEIVAEEQRESETARFVAAATAVADRLAARAAAAHGISAEVLAATSALASDKGWIKAVSKLIAKGTHPQAAVAATTDQFVAMFENLGGRMAERTTDLRDIRDRILAELAGLPEPGIPSPSVPSVLCAADLAPADTAGLDPARIVAIVTELGGPTSHTAIIARQLGIPCVVAADGLHEISEGDVVVVDGGLGVVQLGVEPDEARDRVRADHERRDAIRSWRGPAATRDGFRVQILANVADAAASAQAAQTAAEGVGLFRTELCFLQAANEPSVDEQTAIYRGVFEAFEGRKVVVRTLDAGSDKPLAFATLADEENPALGVRGIRIGQVHPGITERQLDAIAAAAGDNRDQAWVMAPMIATIDEAEAFAALVRERGMVPGVMVEVPAVALLAPQFLQVVDFLSIGTNDLSQYTMAADRLSPSLAGLTDAWQPAVLHLIAQTAAAGVAAGKPVGVCGEAAADPLLACVLTGLGVTSLSMAATAIPAVGAKVGTVTRERCEQAAHACLGARTVGDARRVAAEILG